MARRGERKPRPLAGDPTDPRGLTAWALRFLEAQRVRNLSPRTVELRKGCLHYFLEWCQARSLTRPTQITRPILQRYQRHLFHYRKRNGKPLSVSAQTTRLVSVRMYFKWLTRENVLLSNPASELDLPKQVHRLPRHVLTHAEVEAVVALPDLDTPLGLRDRAILEVLYSTGIRRMEVQGLVLSDVDCERGTLFVRQGKGGKDRMVPLGARAAAFVEVYLQEVRPQLVVPPDEGGLFLTQEGHPILPTRLSQMVRNYVRRADLGKSGACHLMRHSMATAMLENGADVRYIQEMLGHVELSTTQIYTRVSIRRLQEIHAATHPGAKLGRGERGAELAAELEDALGEAAELAELEEGEASEVPTE